MMELFGLTLEQIMAIMLNNNSHFLRGSFQGKDGKTILSFAIALENKAPALEASIEQFEAKDAQSTLGDSRSYCRLFDGQDNGPPDRRCWLLPGHQSPCQTKAEVTGKP